MQKTITDNTIFFSLILVIFIITVILLQVSYEIELNELTELLEESESCELCAYRLNEKYIYGLGGIYNEGRYYCVWVEGRTVEEQQDMKYHEMCRHLVYSNPDRYCGSKEW